jgi:ADP-dependent NAD(P)H-hydrate dehydratase
MSPPDRNKRIGPSLLRHWPVPLQRGDKDARGTVLIVAGAPQLPGPVLLSAISALRAGAGKLQIATAPEIVLHIGTAIPEALVVPFSQARECAEHADAVVFGPGIDPSDETSALLRTLLQTSKARFLIDAGGLSVLGSDPQMLHGAAHLPVLTPHAGELSAMLGAERDSIASDPLSYLQRAIQTFEAVVALKGRSTHIAAPGTPVYENLTGHDGLATSGSGDTLAGIGGGLLARGADPLQAAVWAVYLHATAGKRLGSRIGVGFLAREIPAAIPAILRELSSAKR